MPKFKTVEIYDLVKVIPGLKELLVHGTHDINILSKLYEVLDNYAEQNGIQLFQIHRMPDQSPVVVFRMKE